MTFTDSALAIFSFVFAGAVYWYATSFTCADFGFTFAQIGSGCNLFFSLVCAGIALIGVYYLARFFFTGSKHYRHGYLR